MYLEICQPDLHVYIEFLFYQDVNFMMMDCSNGKLLEGLESVFQSIFVPSLSACKVTADK